VALALCASLAMFLVAPRATAQEDDELGEDKAEEKAPAGTPNPHEPDVYPEAGKEEHEPPPAAPPPPTPPAPPPSPFVFIVKGMVSGSLFMQDQPAASQGGALTFGGVKVAGDKWFLGGDVRQTRLTFTIRGPEVLGGAVPTGVTEMDLGGYNYQITPVGGLSAVVGTRTPMGPTTVALPYNTVTNEPRFDESLVPHIRLAYVELNWNNSQNVLRVGQYHNLLLGMIAGSASHIATPLGYGAGQLGWRSPGVTYLHRFKLSADTNLDIGLQINRNSWRDELPNCATAPGAPQAPEANCLPAGISVGEASMIPQVEARVMAFGGVAESPLPFYLPTKWHAYIVGHWDIKDLSGVGNATTPVAPLRDSMATYVVQGGFKVQLGPVLVAANGWYGRNTGNVFGNIFQMQDLNRPDIDGFGGWGQLGLGVTKHFSLWVFGGIDHPDEAMVKAALPTVAGITRLQNIQAAGQLAYTEGPIQIGLEVLYVATKNYIPPSMAMPVEGAETIGVVQPSVTMNYNF
jgi:hypothetical protein